MNKGVLDRIVDREKAIILIEELNKELVVNVSVLPVEPKEGTWFDVTLDKTGTKIEHLVINDQITVEKEREISQTLSRIRSKSSGSRFKRK
jgi:hypothetical protein